MAVKQILKEFIPPVMISAYRKCTKTKTGRKTFDGDGQDLDLYWDSDFAEVLETWGEGNVWNEIPLLFASLEGKVIDIACGTGRTMEILDDNKNLEIYGCDISDLLINKAEERGILKERLLVCDATDLPYEKNQFEYGYSIGSIEHFTEDGIAKFISECRRTVSKTSFHQHPTSRSGKNEGWITTTQSYHNNSVEWWTEFYEASYEEVSIYDSIWEDEISLGKWFVCK